MDDRPHEATSPSDSGTVACRVCGAENRSSRLFCAQCGTYLKGEEEDTWVDLPGRPAGAAAAAPPAPRPPSTPTRTTPSPPAPADAPSGSTPYGPPPTSPPKRAARGDAWDEAPAYPPPPGGRRRWVLAAFLVVLLLAAAGVTGAVAYRALLAPDDPVGDGGSGVGATSTTAVSGGGSATTTTQDGGPGTTTAPTTSTTRAVDLGSPLDVASTFASSTLPAEGENDYRDRNVIDGRLSTCWSEGVGGDGVGEWVRLDLDGPTTLSVIEIANGYQKDARRFAGNPRIERLRVEYSNGSSQLVRLYDDTGFQSITAPPEPTEWVKLVIESTYPGDTWEDTSISEVRLFGAR